MRLNKLVANFNVTPDLNRVPKFTAENLYNARKINCRFSVLAVNFGTQLNSHVPY